MRRYQLALILGTTSAVLVIVSFMYYVHTDQEVQFNRTKLETILRTTAQRRDYVKKIESIKSYSSKIVDLSHQGSTNVEYEIDLKDHDVKSLFSKVASTYTEGMFFLDAATVESTSSGISVSMKGFKLGGVQ